MGGGSTTTQTGSSNTSTMPQIKNPAVKALINSSATGVTNEQAAAPLTQYNAPNPMQIAPFNTLQTSGANLIPSLTASQPAQELALQYAQQAPGIAGTVPTGAGIATDPAIQAQVADYYKNSVPQIQNQYALSGLGNSSSLGNAEAMGLSNMLPSLYSAQLNREQQASLAEASTMSGLVNPLEGIAQNNVGNVNTAIGQSEAIGGTQQQTLQAQYQAQYQDFLRQQALSEQALYTPFADLVPAGTIGQSSTGTSSGSSSTSGGLFK